MHTAGLLRCAGAIGVRAIVPVWNEARSLCTGQGYEFWVTVSTSAGERLATRIATRSAEVRDPALIVSFSREVSVPLRQDLELPCRTAYTSEGVAGK
ncbi:hypothetical protein MTO96_040274, partial [Rhipicephalus appendiculatus]